MAARLDTIEPRRFALSALSAVAVVASIGFVFAGQKYLWFGLLFGCLVFLVVFYFLLSEFLFRAERVLPVGGAVGSARGGAGESARSENVPAAI